MNGKTDFYGQFGTSLTKSDIDRLHMLTGDWQLLADLAGADIVLWLPQENDRYIAAAHCRPATGVTIHLDDVVRLYASPMRAERLAEVYRRGQVIFPEDVRWAGSYSVMEGWVPVTNHGKTIAVLSLEINAQINRSADAQVNWMGDVAEIICQMIADGNYPESVLPSATRHGIPRVSDGALLMDVDGRVKNLSPNARSCFRRLGIGHSLQGQLLAENLTTHLQEQTTVDEMLAVVVMGKAAWTTEVESMQATVSLRSVPLMLEKERVGALLLCRDVTEMRRRQREMMSKDATIREIHHRVKNNLQTVSALLRMQARRSDSTQVKEALGEAERRVATIARVHQELSQVVDETVEFDNLIGRILELSASATSTGQNITTRCSGSFGKIDSDSASVLAVVVSELVANSVEHAFGGKDGTVCLHAERADGLLDMTLTDDGIGIGEQALTGLGTNIVKTMVRGELRGTVEWNSLPEGGTQVHLRAPIKE